MRSQLQFSIILDFMERHGDISEHTQNTQRRLDNNKKWIELVDILNSQLPREKAKSLEKWRKAWSDFKNNIRKKVHKIEKLGMGPDLSDVEKRVLHLIDIKRDRRESLVNNDSNIILKKEKDVSHLEALSSSSRFYCEVDGLSKRRKSSSSSYSSSSSTSQSSEKAKRFKRSRSKTPGPNNTDDMKDIASKFLEFEKERDRMAHEREMARIKQNDELISVFSKIVNVLESLAPSIQRYLDRDVNERGSCSTGNSNLMEVRSGNMASNI